MSDYIKVDNESMFRAMAIRAGAIDPIYIGHGATARVFRDDSFVYKVYSPKIFDYACEDFLCLAQLWDQYPKVRNYIPEVYGVDNNVLIKQYIDGVTWREVVSRGIKADWGDKDDAIMSVTEAAMELGWSIGDADWTNLVWTGKHCVWIDFSSTAVTEETQKQVMDCMLSARH
jgi:hypothetical protein